MDPDKILKFFAEHLADWSRITLLTLINPITRFELVRVSSDDRPTMVSETTAQKNLWLSPKLIAYAVLSIVLGIAMNSLLPNRIPAPELFKAVAIVFVYWFLYGSLLFWICRALRGCGSYLETLSVSIQVFATIYVVTSFVSLVTSAIISMSPIAERAKEFYFLTSNYGRWHYVKWLIDDPVLLFFALGTILLSIYVPLSLKTVHRFGWFRTALLFLIPFIMVWISISVYRGTGVMTGGRK